jgi:hypothetical protein
MKAKILAFFLKYCHISCSFLFPYPSERPIISCLVGSLRVFIGIYLCSFACLPAGNNASARASSSTYPDGRKNSYNRYRQLSKKEKCDIN